MSSLRQRVHSTPYDPVPYGVPFSPTAPEEKAAAPKEKDAVTAELKSILARFRDAEERDDAGAMYDAWRTLIDHAAYKKATSSIVFQLLVLLSSVHRVKREALEARVQKLEAAAGDELRGAAGMHYCGIYRAGHTYGRQAAVTHQGGLWIALRDETKSVPGSGNEWQLAVKSRARGAR